MLLTSESVCKGHPDKLCDQVSDAILDAMLEQDPLSRVAVECMVTDNLFVVAGEVTTNANVDIEKLVRAKIRDIGYLEYHHGIDPGNCRVLIALKPQTHDIKVAVDTGSNKEQGAGDQGMMFGYATDETKELLPCPIVIAHRMVRRLDEFRESGKAPWLRPDGKAQITVKYDSDHNIEGIVGVVLSAQHDPSVDVDTVRRELRRSVVGAVTYNLLIRGHTVQINPAGAFNTGGPAGDTGLTGRKIMVDTYGGVGRHGGGAFSGKDPSKVDRSGAYMARYIAKNIVAAGLAKRCEVQIAYVIGVSTPVSVMVDTFGTGSVTDEVLESAVKKVFDMRPAQIIEKFKLLRPIYSQTACYGHFGKTGLPWEETDKIKELRKETGY